MEEGQSTAMEVDKEKEKELVDNGHPGVPLRPAHLEIPVGHLVQLLEGARRDS